jgi:hypothetical protein
VEPGLGPPDGRRSLQSQSHDRPSADGDATELMSTLVSAWLEASFPLALDEQLPTAPLIGHAAFRHPASYPEAVREGKVVIDSGGKGMTHWSGPSVCWSGLSVL